MTTRSGDVAAGAARGVANGDGGDGGEDGARDDGNRQTDAAATWKAFLSSANHAATTTTTAVMMAPWRADMTLRELPTGGGRRGEGVGRNQAL